MDKSNKLILQGRLEEYRALRVEMLAIINSRLWGQATYSVVTAGLFSFADKNYIQECLIFIIVVSIPFVFHTIQREHARIRMGNYIRIILEPNIPGLSWEEYLGYWRGNHDSSSSKGWLSVKDRLKHILLLAGLYFTISCFCWLLLMMPETKATIIEQGLGSISILLLVLSLWKFFHLYDQGDKELVTLKQIKEENGRT